MKRILILTGVTLLFVMPTSRSLAGGPGPAKMLSRLPPAVRQTIRAQLGNGRLNSIEKDAEDGDLTCDVEMTRDGRQRDFTVGAAGELIDQQVFLPELPSATQKCLQAQAGGGTLDDIYKSTDDGETSYDAELTSNGRTRDVTVADDGRLMSFEMFPDELPAAVRQAIQKQAADAAPDEIDKTFDDGTNFEVDLTQAGRDRDFTVRPDGTLLDAQVFLNELPAALQAAIQRESHGAKVGDIYKSVDDGEVSYDVDLAAGPVVRTVTFDPTGTVLSQEHPIALAEAPAAIQEAIKGLPNGGGTPIISQVTEDGTIFYDVELPTADGRKSLSLAADGKILPDEN